MGCARRLDAIYRSESRRVLATLIRLLGDFDLTGGAGAHRANRVRQRRGRTTSLGERDEGSAF